MLRIPLLVALLASASARAGDATFTGFDDFATRYRAAAPAARDALAASFVAWQQRSRGGFPIIERSGAVLVWFGTGREESVAVGGDFKPRHHFTVYWDERGEPMERVADGGTVWYRRVPLEADARVDYAFRVDGRWQVDPLNPRTGGSQIGIASLLAMPGFVEPIEAVSRANVAKGTLKTVEEPWATPKVRVYLPPGYDSRHRYAVVYAADGEKWIEHAALPTILDNLRADRTVQPVIAVTIDAAEDRGDWYFFNSNYLGYLARVVEWVDAHYSTVRAPEGRLHVGSSSGGRGALWAVLSRPDLFGNVALFSANYSGPVSILSPYATGEKRPDPRLRVWMSAGSHESYIVDDTRTMQRWFGRLGHPLRVVYTHGGHNWGTWRSLVKDALRYFYPASDASAVGSGVVEN